MVGYFYAKICSKISRFFPLATLTQYSASDLDFKSNSSDSCTDAISVGEANCISRLKTTKIKL